MADLNIDLGATDLFSLGASFHAQSSSSEGYSTEAVALAADGDVACTRLHDSGTNYSATYKFCGTNIVTALGSVLAEFGGVRNGKLVTGIDISFSAGEQPEITVNGHNHTTNAHGATNAPNVFNVSAAIAGTVGAGNVAEIGTQAGTNADVVSSSFSFSLNHIDVEGSQGHAAGESITARCDVTLEYVGVPSVTASSWNQILYAYTDGNEELDAATVTAHRFFDAT